MPRKKAPQVSQEDHEEEPQLILETLLSDFFIEESIIFGKRGMSREKKLFAEGAKKIRQNIRGEPLSEDEDLESENDADISPDNERNH
jgi:hypothetical protein